MSYVCPECGGIGKKGRRKCKLCKGNKKVNENELRQRSGKLEKAVYRTASDGTFERVDSKRRRR